MFVLTWATLFFSVKGSIADTGASGWGPQDCVGRYCVTLSERQLTAEAGLCVVIPCSFTTADEFKPKHTIWYKCETSKTKCSDADIIFHSNKNTDKKLQTGFEGRVSRLEPDVSQKNCSIIINDLKESDSGSYQLRVTGERDGKEDGYTFNQRVTVSIKGLSQEPTVMIPTLTERQEATLICTAPGLCSGSVPEITWTWRGAGGTESYITGNSTAFKSESLTAFTQRHVSTLTFKPSAKHHKNSVTCKINFTGGKTTEKTLTVDVNHRKKIKISGVTTVKEGDVLNLTCRIESVPPSRIMWSELGSDTNLHNDTGSSTIFIQNVKPEHAGQYICTVKHMKNTLKRNVSITVTYIRVPEITGITTVKEGDVLNLTCSVESFPPSLIMWSKLGSDTNLHNYSGSARLVIQNVKPEHAGQYICTVKHMDNTLKENVSITVTYIRVPEITGITTVKEGDALNLTCSVESVPPSLIMWSKLGSDTKLHNDTGSSTIFIQNVKPEHAGQYICTAKSMNQSLKENITIRVIYNRAAQIIGNTTVKKGDVLNLTCRAESFPPSVIVWSKLSSSTKLHNDTESATLVIPDLRSEHSGQYICTVTHLDTTLTSYVDVTVTWHTKIQNGSGCVLQSEGLTCVCISEGFPLPTIKWPLLGNHTEYSIIMTVSNHTVHSTVSLNVKNHGNSAVECVSNNGNGEERENLLIIDNLSKKEEESSGFRWRFLEIIIAFLIGAVLSSGVCFLAKKCYRKKTKSSGHLNDTLVMLTHPDDPLIYEGQALQNNQTLNSNSGTNDVVYAKIDFSLLKTKSGRKAAWTQESTKTEYAEIKKVIIKEQVDDGGEEGEMLEGEMKHCEPEKTEGEDEPVYSTMNDVKDDI